MRVSAASGLAGTSRGRKSLLVLSRGKRPRVLVGQEGREVRSPPAGRAVLEGKGPGEAGARGWSCRARRVGALWNYWGGGGGGGRRGRDPGRWVVVLHGNPSGERPQRGLDLRQGNGPLAGSLGGRFLRGWVLGGRGDPGTRGAHLGLRRLAPASRTLPPREC